MDHNNTQAALDAGAALATTREINGIPVAIVPEGYKPQYFEQLLDAPTRHRGTTELLDAASFITYVNQFKDSTKLSPRVYFRTEPKPSFVAVLNDCTHADPAWRDFRAVYNAPLSKEWETWTGQDKQAMGQEEFALFIERNLPDIFSPPAADMLEIASTFQAKKGVNFASGTRLNNGQVQFKFEETIQAKAGEKGQFEIPEQFEIVIPVFDGSTTGDRIVAKFRYRIADNKLKIWYELDRPHKVLDAAVTALRREIEAGLGLEMLKGIPTA